MNSPFAFVLLSGGLDSILATRILIEQGIDVEAIGFTTPFFNAEKGQMAAEKLGIPFYEIDFSEAHFEKVKNPRYGHGSAINPCIDCHALMIRTAWNFLAQKRGVGETFIVTGEVLGQRPMSQNKQSLQLVEKLANLPGKRLLRPLSAQLLEETEPEKKGWIDRNRLLDLSGRGRKKQLKLAKKFEINYFSPPAGGCVLTEKNFGQLLRELLEKWPQADFETANLLRWGRVFFHKDCVTIIARTEEENNILQKIKRDGDFQIKLQNLPGPLVIIRPYGDELKISHEAIKEAQEKIQRYSRRARELDFSKLRFQII